MFSRLLVALSERVLSVRKEARNEAFREAIAICEMWKQSCEMELAEEKRVHGTMNSYGKINLMDLCIQRIEEKITGVRRWS